MKNLETNLGAGIWSLPSFPVVLITVGRNIMTAGAFHFYSFEPPSVMVGIMRDKHTYQLINQYNAFGINIPRIDQIELVRICGSVSGRDVDKYTRAGVTPLPAVAIEGFLVQECPLNIECEVVHKVDHRGSHHWFIGEIRAVHRDDGYSRDQALMFWSGEYRQVGKFLQYS